MSSSSGNVGNVKSRHYMSTDLLSAAARFVKLSADIETEAAAGHDNILKMRNRSYVIGCLTTSVSFVEACINELFCDAAEDDADDIDDEIELRLGAIWEAESIRLRTSILEKYQIALKLAGEPLFEKGQNPYQDAKLVIDLRNAIVHFKPEWTAIHGKVDAEKTTNKILREKLAGKFAFVNPMEWQGDIFFPNHCLNHTCALWAIRACIAFVNDFFDRIDIDPDYWTDPFLKHELDQI